MLSDRGTMSMNASCSRCGGSGMDHVRTPGTTWRTFQVRRSASIASATNSRCAGPQFAAVLWQGVLKALGIHTNYATPYHLQTYGQVERFSKTLVKQLRHYVSDHVVTWSRYLNLVGTAYNSQVYGSTGQVPFALVNPRRLTPVTIDRLTVGADTGEIVTPGRARENVLQRLDALIPQVRDTMEKAQARYKRAFDKHVQARREALRVGEWGIREVAREPGGEFRL